LPPLIGVCRNRDGTDGLVDDGLVLVAESASTPFQGEQSLAAGYGAHSVVPYHIGAPRYEQAKPVLRVFRFRQGQTVAA
jgi:hypothetical protein